MAKSKKEIAANVVRAQSFVLVDENGTEKAQFMATESGTTIHLLDSQGAPRVTLQVGQDGNPSIILFDRNDVPGVSLGVVENNGRGMAIMDSLGSLISMGIPDPGQPPHPDGDHANLRIVDGSSSLTWSAIP